MPPIEEMEAGHPSAEYLHILVYPHLPINVIKSTLLESESKHHYQKSCTVKNLGSNSRFPVQAIRIENIKIVFI